MHAAKQGEQAKEQFIVNAVYLGIKGYGKVNKLQVRRKAFAGFRFLVDDEEKVFGIKITPDFSIQNKLQHGETYNLKIVGNRIEDAEIQQGSIIEYIPPVQGKQNVRTLKNLFATAMEPVGTVLYVFGGGWNWQGTDTSLREQETGLKKSWIKFFKSQDANYNYKFVAGTNNKKIDKAKSFYPFGGWNEFHYAGLDCCGYLGWVLDNLMPKQNGKKYTATIAMAPKSLLDFGLGTVTRDKITGLKPGVIVSTEDHVYMCVGTCEDDSIVILHSSSSESKSGEKGGGVQLSALNPQGTEDCEAYRLVRYYMKRYFPEWSERYDAVLEDYSVYTNFSQSEVTGIFNWSEDVLPDPDDYCKKNAGEILKDLFGEHL